MAVPRLHEPKVPDMVQVVAKRVLQYSPPPIGLDHQEDWDHH